MNDISHLTRRPKSRRARQEAIHAIYDKDDPILIDQINLRTLVEKICLNFEKKMICFQ